MTAGSHKLLDNAAMRAVEIITWDPVSICIKELPWSRQLSHFDLDFYKHQRPIVDWLRWS